MLAYILGYIYFISSVKGWGIKVLVSSLMKIYMYKWKITNITGRRNIKISFWAFFIADIESYSQHFTQENIPNSKLQNHNETQLNKKFYYFLNQVLLQCYSTCLNDGRWHPRYLFFLFIKSFRNFICVLFLRIFNKTTL